MSETTKNPRMIEACIEKLLTRSTNKPQNYFCLADTEVRQICSEVQEVFRKQAMLLELEAPIMVCGDIHGQYSDLLNIFDNCGFPDRFSYLFLGDYVDRGKQSLETICLLFCYKIKYDKTFYLLRGNHEAFAVNNQYGFYEECKRKMSVRTWKLINQCFNFMPVAAIINDKILCMHGGLSPEMDYYLDIHNIPRPTDITNEGLLTDLMWSDPTREFNDFQKNTERGIAQWFGKQVTLDFMTRNNLDLICRAHQCVEDGYEFMFDQKLITLFSVPNYCGDYDNSAAILVMDQDLVCTLQTFRPPERAKRMYESTPELQMIQEVEHIINISYLKEQIQQYENKENKCNESDAKSIEPDQRKTSKRRATGGFELL